LPNVVKTTLTGASPLLAIVTVFLSSAAARQLLKKAPSWGAPSIERAEVSVLSASASAARTMNAFSCVLVREVFARASSTTFDMRRISAAGIWVSTASARTPAPSRSREP